ncbi:hypothetical protein EJ08DRAFT_641439 [Tothia fuscella]|uniref:DUF2461 domain-containing protein n=1 Tax=Tothia fuscella TaxID=1048955 RepID=A0A9P4NHL4_9PEZI|nr:hypothetical protein EJ08DRAFT_641439 [Tothia fuscella]
MARKSLQPPKGAASRSSSKRPTPSESAVETATPAKRAKRQSTTKVTPKKSEHFTHKDSDDDDDMDDDASLSDQDSENYDDESASAVVSSDEEPESNLEDEESEEDIPQRSRGRTKATSGTPKSEGKGSTKKGKSELWRPGVGAGLGPGTQVVIKKPKAREAGDTPYTDDTIHPNTMHFLEDLAANNDRQWLKMHDPDYRNAQKDWTSFLENLTEKVIEADETIPELPVKDIVFRIYRDVRFSSNPTPYKAAFSAAWSRTGRKGPYAAYYVQVKPGGGSLVAGGLWQPEPNALARMRRIIDRRPQRMKQALAQSSIRKEFLDGVAEDDRKVVKKFVAHNSDNALKTKPKGFDSDHKNIELLRLRSFTLSRKVKDEEVLGANGLSRIAELIGCLVPFVTYLNSVVMPDDESDSSDEDNDNRDDE